MRKTYSEYIQLNVVLCYKASFDYGFIGDGYVFQLKWSFPNNKSYSENSGGFDKMTTGR
jgi:hypothetical protein